MGEKKIINEFEHIKQERKGESEKKESFSISKLRVVSSWIGSSLIKRYLNLNRSMLVGSLKKKKKTGTKPTQFFFFLTENRQNP